MFGISLARISLLTGTSLGGGVGVSPTLDLNFRGQGYSAAMAGYTFNQLIDFTRTSSATYVDATGKIVSTPASRNLLTFTQEFDNAGWVKSFATVAANSAAAPDGTMTADAVTNTGSSALTQTVTVTASTNYVFSFYAKLGTATGLSYFIWNSSAGSTLVAVTSYLSQVNSSGWVRVSVPFTTPVGCTSIIVDPYRASTGSVFLWGAQLEAGSTATDYTRNNGGVYPPRFDYDPVTLAPKGLLVEEQRTNLLVRSEEFDNGAWIKNNVTVTANAIVAPDGNVTADALVENTANAQHQWYQQLTVTAATHIFSMYAKRIPGASRYFAIYPQGATSAWAVFDLTTGTITATGGANYSASSITSVGDGWYKCSVTFTTAAAGLFATLYLTNSSGSPSNAYTGDGTSGIYIWGAQLETGSTATSYIPTVASQVTRTADVATITGANFSQWYNQSEGTFVVDGRATDNENGQRFMSVSDGTATNQMWIMSAVANYVGNVYAAGAYQAQLGYSTTTGGKYALAYKANDFAFSGNGSPVSTDNSGSVPPAIQLDFGRRYDGVGRLNGHIRSIRYYPTRLSDAQLQALTA